MAAGSWRDDDKRAVVISYRANPQDFVKLSVKKRTRHILDRGMRWRSGPFLFWAAPSKESRPNLSVLGSRKIYPKAVERNRIRRLIRESWWAIEDKIQPNWEILVLPQGGINMKMVKQGEIQEWLMTALTKKRLASI